MYKAVLIRDIPHHIVYPEVASHKWAVVTTDILEGKERAHQSFKMDDEWYSLVSTHPTKGSADRVLRIKLKSQVELPKDDYPRPYHLSLTERQARVITEALDLFSRIGMGQLEEIAHILGSYTKPSESSSLLPERLEEVKRLAREASNVWTGNHFGCRGISSEEIGDTFRVAWDLHQVIRHRLAWDRNPKGGLQVSFDTPMKYSQEPLAIIKKV
jgi:hypothetical protein